VSERDVRRALDALDGVGDGLRLRARRALAVAVSALALGPLLLGQVDDLDHPRGRAALLRARERGGHEDVHGSSVGVPQPALAAERPDSGLERGTQLVAVALAVLPHAELGERLRQELVLPVAEQRADGAVRLEPVAVGTDEPDADRRVLERRAEALLAGAQCRVLAIELDERRDLRAQDVRVVRLEDVVHRADLVSAEHLLALLVDRGQEDDRDLRGPLAALDELGRLEAVHARHLDVQQDRGVVAIQQ
jgi:hypothetical protein